MAYPCKGPGSTCGGPLPGNDRGYPQHDADYWRDRSLNRLRHRTVALNASHEELTVVVRSAGATGRCGYLTTYRWTADTEALRLHVATEPVR